MVARGQRLATLERAEAGATWCGSIRRPGARGARGRARPRARGRRAAPLHRRVPLLPGRLEGADIHQHPQGLAAEHAGGLLGPRPRERRAGAAGCGLRAHLPPVREVRPRRRAGRVPLPERPPRRGPRHPRDHAPHGHGLADAVQRHLRLGLRGGVVPARRVPLEPRRGEHRVLGDRRGGGRGLPPHRQHLGALLEDHADPVPEGRDDERSLPHRRDPGGRRGGALDGCPRGSLEQLRRADGGRSRRTRPPALQPPAEPQRRDRGCADGRDAGRLHRRGDAGRADDPRWSTAAAASPSSANGRLAPPLRRVARRERRPARHPGDDVISIRHIDEEGGHVDFIACRTTPPGASSTARDSTERASRSA